MSDAIGQGQSLAKELLGQVILPPSVEISQDVPRVDGCVHFWIIEAPNGPTSQGICRMCGKVQLFRNSVSSSTWNRGIAKREEDWL